MSKTTARKPSALIEAASRLAETLEDENAALKVLDIPRAVRLVGAKTEALTSVQALMTMRAGARPDEREDVERLNRRLMHELARNKRLLEQAMHVQGRIIGMIARAIPRAMAVNASRYGAKGAIPAQDLKQPVAFSSRA